MSRARAGKVLTETGVDGAWDVRGTVSVVAPGFVLEIVPAIDEDPSLAKMRAEELRGNQRAVGHVVRSVNER